MGCDGTVVNTGSKYGVIRQIETSLKKPVQWFICLLHANELPLRHLMQQLDGNTSDPRGFTGTIGKLLDKCDQINFQPINVELPSIDYNELSTDQKIYSRCVKRFKVAVYPWQKGNPVRYYIRGGWLWQTGYWGYYVATINPSESLTVLSEFIVKVYATSWFLIKSQSACNSKRLRVE